MGEETECSLLVQVLDYFLQKRVDVHIQFCFLEELQKLHMFCYDLPEVCHFLEQFGKELGGVWVVHFEL